MSTLWSGFPWPPLPNQVTVHAPGCEYDNCIGCVVMPDPEGGYEVQLPGVDHWLHFERSELEFAAGAR